MIPRPPRPHPSRWLLPAAALVAALAGSTSPAHGADADPAADDSATSTPATHSTSTNTPSDTPSDTTPPAAASSNLRSPSANDFAAYRLIVDRNIFNSKRSGRQNERPRDSRRTPRVDSFGLVGTLTYDKGPVAFFDGSDRDFRKALRPGDSIAGYKVASIDVHGVHLEADGQSLDLKVGSQMRREEGGAWKIADTRTDFAASPSSTGTAGSSGDGSASANPGSSAGGGEMSEVLKRLMQKREQELNR